MRLVSTTPDGEFAAHYSAQGLRQLEFPKSSCKPGMEKENVPEKFMEWHEATSRAVLGILAGRAPAKLPPLDLSAGTEFQQRVWNALRRIEFGATRSYGEVASMIGSPGAVRAVGGACGANPVPLLVPCHRVLAANQKLGGFSGGLNWKRKLLAVEGVLLLF